ncbi:MAG: phosphate acyltransferase PlsX [Dehalococcoidia bacterium]|nr:phosphate acyltransferase PlsX [Dehalococcoidia bacterium]
MTAVILDGMGGDHAPRTSVEGAVLAARRGVEVLLVGDTVTLQAELARMGDAHPRVRIVHAPDAIPMGEHSAREAVARRGSSIYVGMEVLKRGEGQAFVSLGNTGAVLAVAFVVLGRLPGVERPALALLLPRPGSPVLFLDVGANAEARVSHLLQFARLGTAYMRYVQHVPQPRVGLLNIGEEPSKGSPFTVEVHEALASAHGVDFMGNVEGREIVSGSADVIVTDGFTGNVALKLLEGTITMMFEQFSRAARSSPLSLLGGALLRPRVRRLQHEFDYRRSGGAPLLGVNGIVMVGHGRSDAEAVAGAVVTAAAAAEARMLEELRRAIEREPSLSSNGNAPREADARAERTT